MKPVCNMGMGVLLLGLSLSSELGQTAWATGIKVRPDGTLGVTKTSILQAFKCGHRIVTLLSSGPDDFLLEVSYKDKEHYREFDFSDAVRSHLDEGHSLDKAEAKCFKGQALVGLYIPDLVDPSKTAYLLLTDAGRVIPGYNLTGHAALAVTAEKR